jgi:hypothetical protein
MSINISSEVGLFQEFLVSRSASGAAPDSLEDAVQEFRQYQQELAHLKQQLQVGLEQCQRGESKPFDAESTKKRLRERLASEKTSTMHPEGV